MELLNLPIHEHWTPQENEAFFKAVRKHGKDYDKIQKEVPTKHRTQIFNKCRVEYRKLIKSGDNKKKLDIDVLEFLKQKRVRIWKAYEN